MNPSMSVLWRQCLSDMLCSCLHCCHTLAVGKGSHFLYHTLYRNYILLSFSFQSLTKERSNTLRVVRPCTSQHFASHIDYLPVGKTWRSSRILILQFYNWIHSWHLRGHSGHTSIHHWYDTGGDGMSCMWRCVRRSKESWGDVRRCKKIKEM